MEWSTDIAALTPDAIHRVCRAIKNGANEDDAAYNAGLDPQALMAWLVEGRDPNARWPCRQLYGRVGLALYNFQVRHLKKIEALGGKGSMYILDRRLPAKWGQVFRNDVSVVHKQDSGGALTAGMAEDQIREQLSRALNAVVASNGAAQITMTQTTQTLRVETADETLREVEVLPLPPPAEESDGEGD